jgi:voltage-gated potassium channel
MPIPSAQRGFRPPWVERILARTKLILKVREARGAPDNFSPTDTKTLSIPRYCYDASLLFHRITLLQIDRDELSREKPLLLRELQGLCTLCGSKLECLRDLERERETGEPQNWHEYCPNAATLHALGALQNCPLAAQTLNAPSSKTPSITLEHMFDRLRSGLWPWFPQVFSNAITSIGLLAMVLGASRTVGALDSRLLFGIIIAVWGCLATEFIFRLLTATARPGGPHAYFASTEGLIDLASAIALPLGWLLVPDPRDAALFAAVWALRYIRHTTGLALFWRIMQRTRTALLSIASLFLVVFVTAATLAFAFERDVQPEAFGSVARAAWWAIVTLTTTGYGDVVPTTVWGRLLASWLMIGGIVMVALQAGIIATAFAEELQRRHFLHIWDLVTAVPFFQGLGAAAIADIVRLLKGLDVADGTIIVRRGEPGDTMYFIVSGEATVQLTPKPVILGPGDFFGEMALLFGMPRSATVIATKPSVLLALDIADFRAIAGRQPEIVNVIEAEGKRRREVNAAMACD